MAKMYLKTVNLDRLKKDLKTYALFLLVISVWLSTFVIFSTLVIDDKSSLFDTVLYFAVLFSIAYASMTSLVMLKMAGCLFYLGKEGDSNDKVYL